MHKALIQRKSASDLHRLHCVDGASQGWSVLAVLDHVALGESRHFDVSVFFLLADGLS